MSDEFITLLKTLRIPLLAEPDVAKLKVLQKEWRHWESRELQHAPLRIAEEQRAAYAAFIGNPTAENEQRLVVLADANLTGTRSAMLLPACSQSTALAERMIAGWNPGFFRHEGRERPRQRAGC